MHQFNLNFSKRNILFGTWLKETNWVHLVLIPPLPAKMSSSPSSQSSFPMLFGRAVHSLA